MEAVADVVAVAPARTHIDTGYVYNWDRLRIVGSLDILGSHLGEAHIFGGIGLPAFLMLSIALGVRSSERHAPAFVARQRAQRILVPWLFWSLVIACERTWRAAAVSGNAFAWVRPSMLLYGAEIHLWYLPYVAVTGIAAALLHHHTQRFASRGLAWIAVLCALLGVAVSPWLGHGWPFEQWAFSLPGVAMGFALGRVLSSPLPNGPVVALRLGAVFAAGVLVLGHELPISPAVALRYIGAVLVVTVGCVLPNRADPLTPKLTPLMLGIYATHMLVYRNLVSPVLHAVGHEHVASARVIATFILSAVIVGLLRGTRLRIVV